MKSLEVRVFGSSDGQWKVDIYDPNIASVIEQMEMQFSSDGHAEVWLDTLGEVDSHNASPDGTHIFYGTVKHAAYNLAKELDILF